MAVSSALLAGRPLLPRKIPGTHFSQRLNLPQDHSAAGRITSIEKSDDLHRQSNSRPSGLQHSASANYATACPHVVVIPQLIFMQLMKKFVCCYGIRKFATRRHKPPPPPPHRAPSEILTNLVLTLTPVCVMSFCNVVLCSTRYPEWSIPVKFCAECRSGVVSNAVDVKQSVSSLRSECRQQSRSGRTIAKSCGCGETAS
jgi:hypothetical protein